MLIKNNWAVHYGNDIREFIDAAGGELRYLPTYSPDFDPTEHLFAEVKSFVNALLPDSTDPLVQAFGDTLKTVTPENIRNSFRHCGYKLEL